MPETGFGDLYLIISVSNRVGKSERALACAGIAPIFAILICPGNISIKFELDNP